MTMDGYLPILRPHVSVKFAQKSPVAYVSQDSRGRFSTTGGVDIKDWFFKLNLLSSLQLCQS